MMCQKCKCVCVCVKSVRQKVMRLVFLRTAGAMRAQQGRQQEAATETSTQTSTQISGKLTIGQEEPPITPSV
jgi:hypothetical protein